MWRVTCTEVCCRCGMLPVLRCVSQVWNVALLRCVLQVWNVTCIEVCCRCGTLPVLRCVLQVCGRLPVLRRGTLPVLRCVLQVWHGVPGSRGSQVAPVCEDLAHQLESQTARGHR